MKFIFENFIPPPPFLNFNPPPYPPWRTKSNSENDQVIRWCPYPSWPLTQKFHFLQKSGFLKFFFHTRQVHTKKRSK